MVHCMSFNEFADKMYDGRRQDSYVHSKFALMQRSFSRYYCELDLCNARKFMQIVLDKLEEEI